MNAIMPRATIEDMAPPGGQIVRQVFVEHSPGLIILNGLSDDELLAIYKQHDPAIKQV